MNHGKEICNQLKELRRNIAKENDIALEIPNCTYQGDCDGTCPRCDAELQYLERELTLRTLMGKAAVVTGLALGLTGGNLTATAQEVATDRQDNSKSLSESNTSAADSCTVKGRVIDDKTLEPLIFANVVLKNHAGEIIAGARTDYDGNFSFRAPKGEYKFGLSYIGYTTTRTTLKLNSDTISVGAMTLSRNGNPPVMMGLIIKERKTPVINIGASENGELIDSDRIQHFPR